MPISNVWALLCLRQLVSKNALQWRNLSVVLNNRWLDSLFKLTTRKQESPSLPVFLWRQPIDYRGYYSERASNAEHVISPSRLWFFNQRNSLDFMAPFIIHTLLVKLPTVTNCIRCIGCLRAVTWNMSLRQYGCNFLLKIHLIFMARFT